MRLVGPERAGHECGPARSRCANSSAASRASPRGAIVELRDKRLGAVVRLRDRGRVEGVGLDDVRAGLEIGAVDARDDLRLRQRQQVVVALEIARRDRESARRGTPPRRACAAGSSCPSRHRAPRCVPRAAPSGARCASRRSVSSVGAMPNGAARGTRRRPASRAPGSSEACPMNRWLQGLMRRPVVCSRPHTERVADRVGQLARFSV